MAGQRKQTNNPNLFLTEKVRIMLVYVCAAKKMSATAFYPETQEIKL